MNGGSIEPGRSVASTHSGKYDEPATGRGKKAAWVGGPTVNTTASHTQPFGFLYLTDNYNQGDFKAQGEGFSFVLKLSDCSLSTGDKTHPLIKTEPGDF